MADHGKLGASSVHHEQEFVRLGAQLGAQQPIDADEAQRWLETNAELPGLAEARERVLAADRAYGSRPGAVMPVGERIAHVQLFLAAVSGLDEARFRGAVVRELSAAPPWAGELARAAAWRVGGDEVALRAMAAEVRTATDSTRSARITRNRSALDAAVRLHEASKRLERFDLMRRSLDAGIDPVIARQLWGKAGEKSNSRSNRR